MNFIIQKLKSKHTEKYTNWAKLINLAYTYKFQLKTTIDSETGDVFDQNVRALLELDDGQEVCGLQFDEFSEESFFGWWSCKMSKEAEVFHRGTFKINKHEEWPKDIRLPTDIQVK